MRALPRDLRREDIQQRIDSSEDPPIGEAIANVDPVPLGGDDTFLPQHAEVPRGQGLARADRRRQLADGPLRAPELDEQEQPIWIGERFAELCMEPEDLLPSPLVRNDASSGYVPIRMQSCAGGGHSTPGPAGAP